MTRTPFGALIALALACAFVATWPFRGDLAQSVAVTTMTRPLAHITSLRFLPNAVSAHALEFDRSDALVIDTRVYGRREVTEHDVSSLKTRGLARSKLVLAYVDVTAVSTASSLWDQAWGLSRPSWSDGDICGLTSAMRVKFWHAEWKALIFRRAGSELDRLIALGFDGIYVGGLNHLSHFSEPTEALYARAASFVAELAAVARKKKHGFAVMSDGNAQLVGRPDFRAAVDGVAVDGLLYGSDGFARRPFADIRRTYKSLRPLYADGIPVFAVEHVTGKELIEETARELRRRGIVPAFEPMTRHMFGLCS